jgi:hypothetical protein
VAQAAESGARYGQFSPDGKMIAYESNESGRSEVFVLPFPGPGPRIAVSVNGGAQPRWRGDGKELFFIGLDERLMAVAISLPAGDTPRVGTPAALFTTRIGGALQNISRQQYFVARDGQRFLMNTVVDHGPLVPITLVLNWNAAAARRVN